MIKYEAFAKHALFIKKITTDQDRVIIKDNKCNGIVVLLKDGNCSVYLMFVYVLPKVYSIISDKVIKVPHGVS
jgi:hypothetical protein